MAASAYAAVASLTRVLDHIQHPSRHRLHFDRNQIENLSEKASFLCDSLENYSQRFCAEKEELARRIADVADEAEQVIDSHVVDQLSQISADEADTGLSSFTKDIDKIIDKIESIMKELMMVKEETAVEEQQRRVSLSAHLSKPSLSGKNSMVGFDEHLVRIMDQVTGDESSLQIIPIVGMGGIGKTTLARNVFDNRCIVDRFDIRTWVTISQEYSVKEILLCLIHGDGELVGRKYAENSENLSEFGEQLHKRLFGRRYLIVMDDIWSTKVWHDLKSFFPENSNGSRIMVTTRLSNVAVSLGFRKPYLMNFLDEHKSWDLFCKKAFAHGAFLPELVKIGKKIVKRCKGLPLAIVVIGGLLANSNMTIEYWEFVAKNLMNSFANLGDDEHCLNILSLSYTHLPVHLKPCFLYMRVFPEDSKIKVSKLIKYWVAEGFVKSKKGKILENIAYEYLKDLTDRNLILTHQLAYNGKIKTCGMHDLLRDLCRREYQKEHSICISKVYEEFFSFRDGTCVFCLCRKASNMIFIPQVPVVSQSISRASSLMCDICRILYSQCNRLRLVRETEICSGFNDREFLHPTRLGYLDLALGDQFVSSSLTPLWNLQTLIIFTGNDKTDLPSEIWEMPQLRHLLMDQAIFHDPPVDEKGSIILESLQTLKRIHNFRCSEEILERIPNLKKLSISYPNGNGDKNWSYYLLCNLAYLHKLVSLYLNFASHINLDREIALPNSLKKLGLGYCYIPWEKMTIIGSLPNLEALHLEHNIGGPEWNPIEGDFLQLKSLTISEADLLCWNVEKEHFPKLEILALHVIKWLEKIPSGIGEIDSFHSIYLLDCSESVVDSANEIIEEQKSFGNEDLQLHFM